MTEKEHLISIDIIRLVSAFAIITIHVSSFVTSFLYLKVPYRSWLASLFLNSFFRWGTPMFIMVSGYLLLNSSLATNPKSFYLRRLQKLFLPFVFWNIFYYFVYGYLNLEHLTLLDFVNRVLGGGPFYHLYFMSLIIGLYFITPFIVKILPKLNLNILLPLFMILSFVYMFLCFKYGLPQLNNIFTWFILYIGYYLAGYWLPRTKFRPTLPLLLLTFLLPVLGFLGNKYLINIYGIGNIGELLTHRLSWLIAIPALTLFQYLLNFKFKFKSLESSVKSLASSSFGVYLVHPAIIQVFVSMHPFADFLKEFPVIWIFSVIPITIVLSFTLVRVIRSFSVLRQIV